MKEKKYFIESDLLRIFAGFCVVLIHGSDRFLLQQPLQGGIAWWVLDVLNILGKVAVPFFIMLSGSLLLSPEKIQSARFFYSRRLNRIAIPFIVWVIIYFFWMWYWGKYTISPLFIIRSIATVSLLHLYFLPLIIGLYAITPLLQKFFLSLKQKNKISIIVVFFLLGFLLNTLPFFYSFNHTFITFFIPYIGYYLLGSMLRVVRLTRFKRTCIFMLVFISIVSTILLRKYDVNSPFVDYLSPLIIVQSIGLYMLLQDVFRKLAQLFNAKSIQVVKGLSVLIFGVFLVHIIVIDVLGSIKIFNPYTVHAPILFFVFLYIFLGFSISCGIIFVLRKIPIVKAIV